MTNGNALTLGGEVLGIVKNRRGYADMSAEERCACEKLHRTMARGLSKMELLQRNNNGLSLAPVDRAYHVMGTNRLYVPLENVKYYTGSQEQAAETQRFGMLMSNEGDGFVLSYPMVTFQSPLAQADGPALLMPTGRTYLSAFDILVLIAISAAVVWFYRSPSQLSATYAAFRH